MELSWKHLTLLIFAGIIATAKAKPGLACARSCGFKHGEKPRDLCSPPTKGFGFVNASLHEWRWMVALREKSSKYQFCGGTLISDKWVVTAAHCLVGIVAGELIAGLGEHNKDTGSETPFTVNVGVKRAILHPDYNRDITFDNDIALLELEDYEPNSAIFPACLPTRNSDESFAEKHVTVTGWGVTENGDPSILQEGEELRIISNDKCSQAYEGKKIDGDKNATITKNMMCNYSYGKDSCSGDSGGPVVWKSPAGYWNLVGVVSWGKGCAQIGNPGVNARVTEYLQWIKDITEYNFQ